MLRFGTPKGTQMHHVELYRTGGEMARISLGRPTATSKIRLRLDTYSANIFEFPEEKVFGTTGSAPIEGVLNYLGEPKPACFQFFFDAGIFFRAI